MIYKALGLMSGSSLDGLDMALVQFVNQADRWSFTLEQTAHIPYSSHWTAVLRDAGQLSALDFARLHVQYGAWLAEQVNAFVEEHQLHHQIHLIASHGHTIFHEPARGLTVQLGDGATLAAHTGIAVVSDLRQMDVALGGQGAPLVPIGERLLFPNYRYFLNIGGIANLSVHHPDAITAYDLCPANRVLNHLVHPSGLEFDAGGRLAAMGIVHPAVLAQLNALAYYQQPAPKSLSNQFGYTEVLPMLEAAQLNREDALATYVEHIACQVAAALQTYQATAESSMHVLCTGGGAWNEFLVDRIRHHLQPLNLQVEVPSEAWVNFKEAIIMALLGVLRWREDETVLPGVTGASRVSIGGALWMGQN